MSRAQARRDQYFNPTAFKPIDESKLSPAGREYRERMADLSREPSQLDSILGRLGKQVRVSHRQHVLTLDTAATVVAEIYRRELDRKNKLMDFSDDQFAVLENIIRYFIGDPSSPFPLHKGLFVYGGYGVGKTFLFRAMQTLCRVAPIDEMSLSIISTKSLVQEYINHKEGKDKKNNPLTQYSQGNLVLDDLGEERQTIVSYTNQEKPIDELLSERYIAFDRYGHLTHVTTNLGIGEEDNALEKQLTGLYGSRIVDRFYDMFEFVLLPGDSKRG